MSDRLRLPLFLRHTLARRLAGSASPPRSPVSRRACLYKIDRLGDFVLALGALHQLVNHYGEQNCRLVVSNVVAPLAAAEFPRVARWEAPPAATGVWREMRPLRRALAPVWATERFAELVCLRHARTLYRDLTLTWLNARTWHGIGEPPSRAALCLANKPELPPDYPAVATAPWSRELLAHGQVVAAAIGRAPDWEELRPRLRSVRAAPGNTWVFCPFGHEKIRDYPEDAWIEAWRGAAALAGPVSVIGPRARAGELMRLAERLRREAGRAEVTVEIDLPLMEFVRSLATARGIVAVESAAAHFAAAFDKPAVALLGGGHFGWFAPWGEACRQRWLVRSLPCFGCGWHCPFPTAKCLTEQPSTAVAQALRELMSHA